MITSYNDFLVERMEGTRSETISMEHAAELIRTRCRNFRPEESPLFFRGRWNSTETGASLTKPAGFDRRSLSGFEHYNLLLDNMPGWAGYPKRRKSVMFSNDSFDTGLYGTAHLIFPLDEAKVGIAPTNDIFSSFTHLLRLTGLSITKLSYAMKAYGVSTVSWEAMESDMDDVWRRIQRGNKRPGNIYVEMFNKLPLMSDSWLDLFAQLLDPADNGFSLVPYDGKLLGGKDNRSKIPGWQPVPLSKFDSAHEAKDNYMPNEMWTAAECVTVDAEYAEELLGYLKP